MSTSSSDFSYNKLSILYGILLGVVVFIVFFAMSYGTSHLLTLNYIFKKAEEWKHKFGDGGTQADKNRLLLNRSNNGLNYIKQIVCILNYVLLGNLVGSKDKDQNNSSLSVILSKWIQNLSFKWTAKLYIVLLAAGSALMLMKLTVNFTVTTIISETIRSNNETAPFGQPEYSPSTSIFTQFLKMILLFALNMCVAVGPTAFVYIWNLICPIYLCDSTKGQKFSWGHFFKKWFTLIATACVLIGALIYFYYNIFSQGLNIFKDEKLNSMTSNTSYSKSILQDSFNKDDSGFVGKIFKFMNSLSGNYGIWIFVYVVFFIFEFHNMFGKKKIDFRTQIIKFLVVALVLFSYSLFVAYRNYGKTDEDNQIFDKNNNLTEPMYKDNVNNLFQAIVKYNYPCMPFENKSS